MRAEAIEKEANAFTGEGECYIHIERTKDSPYGMISVGDPAVILQAVYNVLCELENANGIPVAKSLKMLRRAFRKIGLHEAYSMTK